MKRIHLEWLIWLFAAAPVLYAAGWLSGYDGLKKAAYFFGILPVVLLVLLNGVLCLADRISDPDGSKRKNRQLAAVRRALELVSSMAASAVFRVEGEIRFEVSGLPDGGFLLRENGTESRASEKEIISRVVESGASIEIRRR